MTALSLDAVSYHFGKKMVVDDVNFSITMGEVICLLGPSGCGKTTTLRLAAGLERADSGEIKVGKIIVDSENVFVPPEKRNVGFVFQDYALFPHLTVEENVMFGLKSDTRERLAEEMLDRVGMGLHAKSYPHMLSGGEQQRVALARALAPKPRVMLLDEPFSGLDFRLRDRVGEETLKLLKELGTATVLVTHDSDEAMRLGDRVALMRDGKIIQQGQPMEIYNSPIDVGTAETFSEINNLPGTVNSGYVDTCLGKLSAKGFSEGASVSVIIRPESLKISKDGAYFADIINVRPMGFWTLLELKACTNGTTLLARLSPDRLLSTGERVAVDLGSRPYFVFENGD